MLKIRKILKLRKILKEWKAEANCCEQFQYKYHYKDGDLEIYSSECEKLIGCRGELFYKYHQILKENIPGFHHVGLYKIK